MAVDPVCIKVFIHRYEAEMAQELLESAGINSFILSDDCGGMYPPLDLGKEGLRLMIRRVDLEEAREILES